MATKKVPSYLISASGKVTVYDSGKVYNADATHVNYASIMNALRGKQWSKLASLFDVSATITRKGKGKLSVKNGQVLCDGQPLHHVMVDRIMKHMQEGLDFKPLFNCLKRLWNNPSSNSREQWYNFVEANDLPITYDGYFLAYKKVRENFKDYHTETFDNSPGKTVKMERSDVKEDPNAPCHKGLHVGGLGYARDSYYQGEGKLLVVKVDPANVVSVPNDCSHGKCRTCEYTVLRELEDATRQLRQADASTYVPPTAEGDDYYEDEVCDNCGELVDDCDCEC